MRRALAATGLIASLAAAETPLERAIEACAPDVKACPEVKRLRSLAEEERHQRALKRVAAARAAMADAGSSD